MSDDDGMGWASVSQLHGTMQRVCKLNNNLYTKTTKEAVGRTSSQQNESRKTARFHQTNGVDWNDATFRSFTWCKETIRRLRKNNKTKSLATVSLLLIHTISHPNDRMGKTTKSSTVPT